MTDASQDRNQLPWTPTGVISEGWQIVKRDPSLILVVFAVAVFGNLISLAGVVIAGAAGGDAAGAIKLIADVLNLPLAAFVSIGWIRYLLRVVRGQPADLNLLFSGGGRILRMIGLRLVYAICVVVGLALLIIPGLILMTGWWVCAFELVERDRGVFASLSGSWELTRGHRWSLVLLWLLHVLLAIAGLLFCGVGIFVAIAILAAADTSLYLRLRGEMPVTNAPAPTA